jgi:hypothetical protein
MRPIVVLLLSLCLIITSPVFAQSGKSGQWCGYALIENVPQIEASLPLLSRLTMDAQPDSNPADLFQTRISLDGSKAIVEGCWLVTPTRDLIVNWLSLSGGEEQKQSVDAALVFALFAPDGSKDDSAVSVRRYLREHLKEWEAPCDVLC